MLYGWYQIPSFSSCNLEFFYVVSIKDCSFTDQVILSNVKDIEIFKFFIFGQVLKI